MILISCLCFRFRRRNSSLENLNEMFLNDETSDKPKEDRIVKFKDEALPDRGRSRSSKKGQNSKKEGKFKEVGASILKDSCKPKNSSEKSSNENGKPAQKNGKKVKAPNIPPALTSPATQNVNKQLTSGSVVQPETEPVDSKPSLTVEISSKQSVELIKQTAELIKQTSDTSEDGKDSKEESGYDSDQTLATLSAKDSASEASSLNSPASSVKKDIKDSSDLNLAKDGKKSMQKYKI